MPLDLCLRLTLLLLLVRSLLNALETLARPGDYLNGGAYSWSGRRLQRAWTRTGPLALPAAVVLSGQGFLAASVLQLLVGVTLAGQALLLGGEVWLPLLYLLLAVEIMADFRNHTLGHDGSDRMHLLVMMALVVTMSFSTPVARSVGAIFLALVAALAYFTAGAVKAIAPGWRSGRAMAIVLCSENYGQPRLGRWLSRRPRLGRWLGWSVITFELSFPLLVIAGPRSALAALAMALGLHLGIAMVMGLNGFVWSFAATYPSVYWSASLLHRSFALLPWR
jgi:hypothetical protein